MNIIKGSEILVKVIKRIYEKHPNMQEFINYLMLNVCRKQDVSPENIFLLFCFFFIIMGCSKKKLHNRIFCVCQRNSA